MILGISSSLIAAVFETYLIGLIGTTELAAYSFTFPVIAALTSLMLGISIGLSSVLARTVGSGDTSQVKRLTSDGLLLMAFIMIFAAVIGASTTELMFQKFGADETTLPLITDYMDIWYLGLVFFALPFIGANALRATGDARISGILMISGAVMQMILDPLLILGLFGFPKMGIIGAGWAMVVSRFLLCCITFYVLIKHKDLILLSKINFKSMINSWQKILVVGLPATATNLIGPISTAIVITLLAGFGKEAVAGFGIASRLEALSIIPLLALSASIGPFVGQNHGAELFGRANEAMKLAFKWALIWGLFIALIFMMGHQILVTLFDDNDLVTNVASLYLLIVPISYGLWGVLMMSSATFNALGKPLASTTLSVFRMFVIYVPLAFLGQYYWGIAGIFLAAALSNILTGVFAFLWNRRIYGADNTKS
ncbi:MAG: putative MATE family efflux protein [Candidatus Azotimanducaceae bacterium]|jgi:putative MATE family efflux protein